MSTLAHAVMALSVAAVVLRAATAAGRRPRRGWALVAAGMGLWTTGDVLCREHAWAGPPPASAAVLLGGAYLLIGLGATHLVGGRRRGRPGAPRGIDLRQALEAACTAAATASLVAGALPDAVILGLLEDPWTSAAQLVRPTADGLMLAIVLAAVVLRGGRASRAEQGSIAALLALTVADLLFARAAGLGTWHPGAVWSLLWPLSLALTAVAAWLPTAPRGRSRDASRLPLLLAAGTVAMLATDQVDVVELDPVSSALAFVTIGLALLTLRAAERLLAGTLDRTEAASLTDAVTGLGNRRALFADLDAALTAGRRASVVLFDLDGFKDFNDLFGHLEGDELLLRLGRRLAQTPDAAAYRMGGDEFCLLAETDDPVRVRDLAERGRNALSEMGRAFEVTASCGTASAGPGGAGSAELLRLADERMFAQKRTGRLGPIAQGRALLLGVLAEHSADRAHGTAEVADVAVAIAAELGLPPDEVAHVRLTAELHDIGSVARPQQVLASAGADAESTQRLLRRAPVVAERICRRAPALRAVAEAVRGVHERWDGGGYPDGLAGAAIPASSHIVACAIALRSAMEAGADPEAARRAVRAERERALGPEVVDALLRLPIAHGPTTAARLPARTRGGDDTAPGRPLAPTPALAS